MCTSQEQTNLTDINSELKMFYSSISTKYPADVITEYFTKIFDSLDHGKKNAISFLTFYNYNNYPFFVCKKLFDSITYKDQSISKEKFVKFYLDLYKGQPFHKAKIVFELLDINRDGKINNSDTKTLFAHLYSLYGYKTLDDSNSIIDSYFGEKPELTFDDFYEKLLDNDSDLFFLFYYFLIMLKPYEDASIDYFEENILQKEFICRDIKEEEMWYSLYKPKEDLLLFLGFDVDDNNDFEELSDFESSVSLLTEGIRALNITKKKYTQKIPLTKGSLRASLKNTALQINEDCSYSPIFYETKFLGLDNIGSKFLLHASKFRKRTNDIIESCVFTVGFTNSSGENGRIEIAGKDIYIFQIKEKEEFSFILPIKNLGITIDSDTPNKIILCSQLTEIFETFALDFENVEITNDVFDILSKISNFISISDKYFISSVIGTGAFGTVVKASCPAENKKVAIKIIKKNSGKQEELENLYCEKDICKLFKAFPHENIVGTLDIIESINAIYLVQEYIPSGDLDSFSTKSMLSSEELNSIIIQIAKGMKYYASFGITHCDLKPQNILVNHSEEGIKIKIIDFGLAKVAGKKEKLEGENGTLLFFAPEIIRKHPYTNKVDVWSFGLIVFFLCYKFYLFSNNPVCKIPSTILSEQIKLPKKSGNKCEVSSGVKEIIKNCLNRNTQRRPNISELENIIMKL